MQQEVEKIFWPFCHQSIPYSNKSTPVTRVNELRQNWKTRRKKQGKWALNYE